MMQALLDGQPHGFTSVFSLHDFLLQLVEPLAGVEYLADLSVLAYENAVFTQIWIAICDYLLLIIALKMYHIEQNLYIFSNVIGQVLFERTPLNELFDKPIINQNPEDDRQLSIW